MNLEEFKRELERLPLRCQIEWKQELTRFSRQNGVRVHYFPIYPFRGCLTFAVVTANGATRLEARVVVDSPSAAFTNVDLREARELFEYHGVLQDEERPKSGARGIAQRILGMFSFLKLRSGI
jgi:hypothetical protein